MINQQVIIVAGILLGHLVPTQRITQFTKEIIEVEYTYEPHHALEFLQIG